MRGVRHGWRRRLRSPEGPNARRVAAATTGAPGGSGCVAQPRGVRRRYPPVVAVCLAQDADADALLDRDPLALLIGMLLDQQFPMERAFAGPGLIAQRLGVTELDARALAGYDPEALVQVFRGPPAVHRYPGSMAGRVQALASAIVERYDGDAAGLWTGVDDGRELFRRIADLPGFGTQKAQIFTALLGKQRGVTPPGWREAAGDYGLEGSRRSVADITGPESLVEVRAFKQEQKQAAKAAKQTP
jgi:uncharacterized HhH-GPD family protein